MDRGTLRTDATAQVEPANRLECRIAEVLAKLSDDEALTAAEIQERALFAH